MDNRKKKKNKNKNRQNSNANAGQLKAKSQLTEDKEKKENGEDNKSENSKNETGKDEKSKRENNIENKKGNQTGNQIESTDKTNTVSSEEKSKFAESPAQETDQKQSDPEKSEMQQKTDAGRKGETKKKTGVESLTGKSITALSAADVKEIAVKAAKILLPAAACVIIVAVIISYISSQKIKAVENASLGTEADGGAATLSDEPLEENAHSNVNELMNTFYAALADGDMDTVRAIKDYNNDKEIITYEKKSEFIEYYDNINCYTKPGISDDTYFVYVTYTVKIQNIETKAPGLNAWYVYTTGDGSLRIDGDTEENIKAAFKLVTSQDDVVDLYNKIDVSYKEAVASDESLSVFMDELPAQIKTSVGEALAQLETQEESSEAAQTEAQPAEGDEQTQATEQESVSEIEEQPQNQVVNQIVRATDTVNVRSSDSEEADKIGKVQSGTELTRIEDRINGWSKVIFEDREAYIKSDYLEVVTAEATAEPIGSVMALTNVNVRSQASQESAKLGTAQAGSSYDLLEDQGEWFKINYNGTTGFVKAEFFEK